MASPYGLHIWSLSVRSMSLRHAGSWLLRQNAFLALRSMTLQSRSCLQVAYRAQAAHARVLHARAAGGHSVQGKVCQVHGCVATIGFRS